MLSKNPVETGQTDLFRPRLDAMIYVKHELVKLSNLVDWGGLDASLSPYYCARNGRPGASIRMMAGLVLLKEISGLSDEDVCSNWMENPYWQFFCGEEFFQHCQPVEAPSIGNFRRRIGEKGMEIIFAETVKIGLKTGVVKKQDLKIITVDTTVQEKAIRFPTDTHLCDKARKSLVNLAEKNNVALRQNYNRLSKNAAFMSNRYFAAQQFKRGKKSAKKVRNYLGRVIRDIERQIAQHTDLSMLFNAALHKANKIYHQKINDKNKIYSWHAPEVECIAKGKANKRYEFGCKLSFVATNKSNFLIGAMALHGNPYDGHTLKKVIAQATDITGVIPKETHVDQGYKKHGIEDIEVIISRQKRGITPAKKKRQKRRNAIEPIIGHCKNDRKTSPKNHLHGELGDKINGIAMAIGFNLRKILREALIFLFFTILKTQKLNFTQTLKQS